VKIELLADRPEFIPTLAEWHHREWSYLRPGDTIDARISRLQAACRAPELPAVFVASVGGQLIGSAMLLPHDMETRPELSPWLGGVFIAPEFRGRGIGSRLSCHVVQHAAELGFEHLYLYTPSAETFYARLGWSVIEHTRYRDTDVVVMSHERALGHVNQPSPNPSLHRTATGLALRLSWSIFSPVAVGELMRSAKDPHVIHV
jgi:GNAT superfamily N-acetyltransferase